MAAKRASIGFVEPMLLLRTEKLPEGPDWLYELKFDGYRALAIKSGGRVQLRSRNGNDFTARYSSITAALSGLPDDTLLTGKSSLSMLTVSLPSTYCRITVWRLHRCISSFSICSY
jgi:hypothetical protein